MEEEKEEVEIQEETQEEVAEEPAEKPVGKKVAFPKRRRKRLRLNKKALVIIGVILVGGFVGWLIFRGQESEEVSESAPARFEEEITSTPTPIPEPVNKEEIKIEVLNGTGISGEAAFLQGKLSDLGYTQIELGNTDSEDFVKTEVTFSSDLQQEVRDEITEELESIYEEVETGISESLDVDIQIITGYKSGHTPTPTQTATPTPTEEVTPTASPSATPAP